MSRAFVKDSDETVRAEELPERPQSPHVNYVTPLGLRQLQSRVAALAVRRRQLVDDENLASQQELAVVERDLRYYEERVKRAVLVEPENRPRDRVHFGAVVDVCDDSGEVDRFVIVGEDEADVAHGKISWVSPLAKALLNAGLGDHVVWRRPAGDKELEVVGIHPGSSE